MHSGGVYPLAGRSGKGGRPAIDWTRPCVIVAGGQSALLAPIEQARGRANVLVINESWRLAPWAEILYACDWQWWAHRGPSADEFPGRRIIGNLPTGAEVMSHPKRPSKLTPEQRAKLAALEHTPVKAGHGPLIWEGGRIRGGGNSACQAVNLLGQRGCKRILLLGVEGTAGSHWHPEHSHPGRARATADTAKRWRDQWRLIAPDLKERGIEVINCSPISKVDAFPVQPFEIAVCG